MFNIMLLTVKSNKMGKKRLKVALISVLVLIAFASSISVEKLDEVRARTEKNEFDAALYAKNFWEKDLIPNLSQSTEIGELISLLEDNPEKAFKDYSKALGLGNIRFFMIQGKGEIAKIGEDEITIDLPADASGRSIKIATEYIFGNAVRDASGKIDLQEFDQTMDFNMVSAEINKLVRQKVLPELKNNAGVGKEVHFVGALELNKEQFDLREIEIIPLSIEFVPRSK